jgi:gamma-glutamyltranspeptidase
MRQGLWRIVKRKRYADALQAIASKGPACSYFDNIVQQLVDALRATGEVVAENSLANVVML